MALSVGDDSYINVSDADTYHSEMNNTEWTNYSTVQKEAYLRKATQFLDMQYDWVGSISQASQALDWPRADAVDKEGREIGINTIPESVKDACCEVALIEGESGILTNDDRGGKIKEIEAGPVSIEYNENAPSGFTFPYVDGLVENYTVGNSGDNGRLVRA